MADYRPYRPTAEEIQRTARSIVQVLAEHGFHCCLFGSTAAAMYGAENRNPRDVDVVVLVPAASPAAAEITVEEIKQLVADNSSSDFYLQPSRDPNATHKILYHVLTPTHPTPDDSGHHACKVDLLLPGMIGIPKSIPSDVIHYEDYFPDIPLIPFGVLLLLKVGAWYEHQRDGRLRIMREKLKYDRKDIMELLDLAENEYMIRMRDVEAWAGWDWLNVMREYVREYADKFPDTKRSWEAIGVGVQSEWSLPPTRGLPPPQGLPHTRGLLPTRVSR
ncbi:hypothetical protein D9756_008154 [Leucocoprinus leucothites]|uniref:Nucleotidyltransferase n=1 Tax=Leucocoprinus leucothites TaxID=201217 RepID=A0A8H5FW87_9AGAR|nr:hypothetical protein D9756_008154 [Leucoagaricus leucothites]